MGNLINIPHLPTTATIIGGTVTAELDIQVETETVRQVPMPDADTEYEYEFPPNTKSFLIKSQSGHDFKYSPTEGESASEFLTLPTYQQGNIKPIATRKIYFQSERADEVMEISSWI